VIVDCSHVVHELKKTNLISQKQNRQAVGIIADFWKNFFQKSTKLCGHHRKIMVACLYVLNFLSELRCFVAVDLVQTHHFRYSKHENYFP